MFTAKPPAEPPADVRGTFPILKRAIRKPFDPTRSVGIIELYKGVTGDPLLV